MKRNKKFEIILILMIMLGILISGCNNADLNGSDSVKSKEVTGDIISLSEEDYKTIETINENSELGFEFFENLGKDNSGMISVSSEGLEVRGTGYAYQNIDDDVRLSELHISGEKYNVFGIKVGDCIDDAKSKMENYGFDLGTEAVLRAETTRQSFKRGNIYVNFDYDTRNDDNKINKINIIADFTKYYDLNLGTE